MSEVQNGKMPSGSMPKPGKREGVVIRTRAQAIADGVNWSIENRDTAAKFAASDSVALVEESSDGGMLITFGGPTIHMALHFAPRATKSLRTWLSDQESTREQPSAASSSLPANAPQCSCMFFKSRKCPVHGRDDDAA